MALPLAGVFFGLSPSLHPQLPSRRCPSGPLFLNHMGSEKALVNAAATCPVFGQANPVSKILLEQLLVQRPPGSRRTTWNGDVQDLWQRAFCFPYNCELIPEFLCLSLPICEMGPHLPHSSDHADLCSGWSNEGHLQRRPLTLAPPPTRGHFNRKAPPSYLWSSHLGPATLQIIHLDISLHRLTHFILYYSSLLAWEIPWIEEAVWLQYMGSQRVGHDLATKQQQSCIYVNPSLPALLILKATLKGNYHHHPHFTDKQRLQEVAQKHTGRRGQPKLRGPVLNHCTTRPPFR